MSEELTDLEQLAVRTAPRATPTRRLARIASILRYYRKTQIARRVAQRFAPGFVQRRRYAVNVDKPVKLQDGALAAFGRLAQARTVRTDCCLDRMLHDLQDGRLTLLSDQRDLGTPLDWQANITPRPPHLWRFHLHYHEYLLDLAVGTSDSSADPWPTIWNTLESWISGNPARDASPQSDAWHPYCISRRLPVWAQLFALQLPADELLHRLLISVAEQAVVLSRSLEFDLDGNHLLENLRGLALAGCLVETPDRNVWLETAERLLRKQLPKQILEHGEHYELASMYHCQILGNLLQMAVVAKSVRPSLAAYCRSQSGRMLEFLAQIVHPDGEIPLLGDSCFDEAYSVAEIRRLAEAAGLDAAPQHGENSRVVGPYWIWRHQQDALIFDTGEAAANDLPAHGHCDLLGFELSLNKRRWFVDSGLFGYDDDSMRRYCRSSLAHNVVTVDNADCCDVWSKFRMGKRGRPTGFDTGVENDFTWARASHNGYRHRGVAYVGRLLVAHPSSTVACVDSAVDSGGRRLTGRLHVSPMANVKPAEGGYHIVLGNDVRTIQFTPGVDHALAHGWHCTRFGRRERTTVRREIIPHRVPALRRILSYIPLSRPRPKTSLRADRATSTHSSRRDATQNSYDYAAQQARTWRLSDIKLVKPHSSRNLAERGPIRHAILEHAVGCAVSN